MTITLVLPDRISANIGELVLQKVEAGAVLLAHPVHTSDGMKLLGTELYLVPEEAYEVRESDSLLINSGGYVPPLSRAEETRSIPIWLHTHPGIGSTPESSNRDLVVDSRLCDLFRIRSGSDFYGALIVSPAMGHLKFTGHLESDDESFDIDRVLTVGPRFVLVWNYGSKEPELSELFDRNVRAFGGDVQRVFQDLRIGIVGCGGTGSAVGEQLVRLGVRKFQLFDPDALSESNLTRVYGSSPSDIGRPKVDVLADQIIRIAPDAVVEPFKSSITKEECARRLADADVVFGCTDDNAGRLVLSRLATYLLVPVIDCGVLLSSNSAGRLSGIHGRVTVLHPGAACLVCRGRIDLARAGTEMLTPDERIRRVDEGYAPDLLGVEPAVVAYTTQVAAAAVGELIERFAGYGPNPVPSEILLRIHDREASTNSQTPNVGHYCHTDSGKIGIGITDPFLEQTWNG